MKFKNQDFILNRLARFLEFDKPDSPMFSVSKNNINSSSKDIFIDTELRAQLKSQLETKGFCHGLTVLHALMEKEGKLTWWEACLKEIINWDGQENSLDSDINLPDQVESTTRRALFHRVLNYVVIAHVLSGHHFDNFMVGNTRNFNQTKVFAKDYLPLSFATDMQFGPRQFVIGDFKCETWEQVLNEKLLDTSIVLAHTASHTFRIGITKDKPVQWFVYDPNYNHNTGDKPIHKLFQTKQAMINEILRISEGSLGLSFTPLQNNRLEIVEPTLEAENITSNVIQIMTKYAPDKLLMLNDVEKLVMLIENLPKPTFAFLYLYLPQLHHTMLEVIKKNHAIKCKFFDFLFAREEGLGSTYLESLATCLLLKEICLQANDEFKKKLIDLFNNINFSLFIKQTNSDNLLSMFNAILSPLTNKDEDNFILPDLLSLVNKTNEQGISIWQELNAKTSHLCLQIIRLCVNHIQTLDIEAVYTIALTLSLKEKGDFKELCRERHWWRANEFGETRSWQMLMLACQERLKDPTVVKGKDWENYDRLVNLKVSRPGLSGFFSKSVVLPTTNNINDVSLSYNEPSKK